MVVKVFDLDGVGENGCSTAYFHMVVKDGKRFKIERYRCSTAYFHMVVKGNLIQTIYLLCCTSVCFHMVVKDVIKSCSNES